MGNYFVCSLAAIRIFFILVVLTYRMCFAFQLKQKEIVNSQMESCWPTAQLRILDDRLWWDLTFDLMLMIQIFRSSFEFEI